MIRTRKGRLFCKLDTLLAPWAGVRWLVRAVSTRRCNFGTAQPNNVRLAQYNPAPLSPVPAL